MSESILTSPNPVTRLKSHIGTILQIILLFWMMAILAWALADHMRGAQLTWLLPFCAIGLTAGWILARSRKSGWVAGLILFMIYLVVMLLRVGQLGKSLISLLFGLLASAWEALFFQDYSGFMNLRPLVEACWLEVSIPFIRIVRWAVTLTSGDPAFDPLVTAILGCALVFSLAAWEAWAVRRRAQPLFAFLPVCALLLTILYITQSKAASLVLLITIGLALLAMINHRSQITRWEANGIGYAEDIIPDLLWSAGALVLVLSTAAYATSTVKVEPIIDFTRKIYLKGNPQVENLAKSIGIDLRSVDANPFENLRNPGLPRNHLIKAGAQPSEEIVMTIQVEGLSPIPDGDGSFSVPHFYWRGLTYDVYTGRGWRSSQTELSDYLAGEANPAEPASQGRQIRQEIRLIGDLEADEENILYSAGTPINLDQQRRVAWRSSEDIFGVTANTRHYYSTSLVNEVQASSLRLAGETYPQWILDRYSKLPDSVPERVRLLSLNLTSAALTPYDRALAIENYLRTFPYTLDVPSPPPGRDVSDYFLFDLKRGYCDYYATAMVVLSRAAGLPARLVIGYASGLYNPDENQYQVSAADAHSWVEIFFPGYGWIIFEPTAGRPAIDHLSGSPLPQVSSPVISPDLTFALPDWLDRLSWPLFIIAALLLAGLIMLIWLLIDWLRLLNSSPPATVNSLYRRLLRHARRLPFAILPSQTPYEVSTGLADHVGKLVHNHRFNKIIKPGIGEIAHLVDLYVHSIYSPTPPGPADQRDAVQAWNRLRWRLWLGKWLRRLRRKAI